SVRMLGNLSLKVSSEGWRFPTPVDFSAQPSARPAAKLFQPKSSAIEKRKSKIENSSTRLQPAEDAVILKERLLYLLQPPLESLFAGKQVRLPSAPYPYHLEGIAFLMPRSAALLADEMGLGKTMQAILALRLLFH